MIATRQQTSLKPSPTPVRSGFLQRKCACGNHTVAGGGCAECTTKKQVLQRRATNERNVSEVPSIVHEVLRSSGQPLEPATRAIMEPRFGHDFARVRIHDDSASHAAAGQLNARAFTVGQSIHFGAGEYYPESKGGMRLVAHELAHTVQQQGVNAGVQRFSSDGSATENDHLEHEADHAAEEVVAGRFAHVAESARATAPQREDKNKQNQSQAPKIVPPVEPSKAQKKMIDAARRAAAIRTQTAMFKASGVQGASQFSEARRLAQVKFDWTNPNMDQISEVLSGMGGGLVTVDVKVGGAGDPDCGLRAGYVRGHRPPI